MTEALFYDVAGEVRKTAVISDDGRYRYRLCRVWDSDATRLVFVMLNPSTADAEVDDRTIRRCMRFARDKGYGGIDVVNLFAYRASEPADMVSAVRSGVDIIGPANDQALTSAMHPTGLWTSAPTVVAAWGAHPLALVRAIEVYDVHRSVRWHCLGTTKDGRPRHPLYLPARAPLRPWSPPQATPTRPQLP